MYSPSRTVAAFLSGWLLLPAQLLANPSGGVVRGGSATITGQGTGRVDIQQGSQGTLITWDQFNIGAGEVTEFHQPSAAAVAINRTLQNDPSRIFGSLVANGHVYLINPNGVLFGANAKINTQAFLATAIFDGKNLRSKYGYDPSAQAAPGARIENHGRIEAGAGGFVYLVAPIVSNESDGVIVSPDGGIQIAAGHTVYVTDKPGGIAISYTAPADGEAVNLGDLLADGGFVRMRAALLRQAGKIEATTSRVREGVVELVADQDLVLEAGSRTAATGGTAPGENAGQVTAIGERSATLASGAEIDVSASAAHANGGAAELSSKGHVELAGHVSAAAGAGGRAGSLLVDPTTLTLSGAAQVSGAGRVLLTADQLITVASNVLLDGAGSAADPRQRLTLRSGGDIVFSPGAVIRDAGTGLGGTKTWDVDLVAGADLTRNVTGPNPLDADIFALDPTSIGGIHWFDGSGVELVRGDLLVRSAGDVLLENASHLRNVFGDIDLYTARSVEFRARKTVNGVAPGADTVIENGSGDIRVVAEDSVRLQPIVAAPGQNDPLADLRGNAAIRTRGVVGVDALGNPTHENGGSILVWAKTGDVDAGIGNRWLESAPPFFAGSREVAFFPGITIPDFDLAPVVSNRVGPQGGDNNGVEDGILGIGTEAGGDLVVVAGRDVLTRNGLRAQGIRSGGTASGFGTTYNGSHIGVFGRAVSYQSVSDGIFFYDGAVAIAGTPTSRGIVVAGRNLSGDFVMRHGLLSLLAGYSLPSNLQSAADLAQIGLDHPSSLTRDALRAQLSVSAAAASSLASGWVGTLDTPLTVDLVEGSLDTLGRNGVALRTVENPSLVYSETNSGGNARAPSYSAHDSVLLEAETGDVLMLGVDDLLPTPDSLGLPGNPDRNPLVRLLPPSLTVRTHAPAGGRAGDLILLNDFTLFPSTTGGLTLDVAGQVRTANGASSNAARVQISGISTGAAADLAFSIPAGARVLDPQTGLVYTLSQQVDFAPRLAPTAAILNVDFQADAAHATSGVTIPAGTRVVDAAGTVFRSTNDQTILPLDQRFSTGSVVVTPKGGLATEPFLVLPGTRLVAPDGTLFEVAQSAGATVFNAGDGAKSIPVVALTPGRDAPARGLTLVTPDPLIGSITNPTSTGRPAVTKVGFIADSTGLAPSGAAGIFRSLLDPVPGAFVAYGTGSRARGGSDLSSSGLLTQTGIALAPVNGPAGEIRSTHRLVLLDTQLLPPGVSASDVALQADGLAPGGTAPLRPSVYRVLPGNGRPDAGANTIQNIDPSAVWQRNDLAGQARILESDAAPNFDPRTQIAGFSASALAGYYQICHSGVVCGSFVDPQSDTGAVLLRGTAPVHAGDTTAVALHAAQGFARVAFQLAEAADLLAGDGVQRADLVDTTLYIQQVNAGDVTRVSVPLGDALFAGRDRVLTDEITGLPATVVANPNAGITVAGPGKLVVDVPHGNLELSNVSGGLSRGIETIGNPLNPLLPLGSAEIEVHVDGDLLLHDYGSIDSLQGGAIRIVSDHGKVLGGSPPPGYTGKRGIFTLFYDPVQNRVLDSTPTSVTGGGKISVESEGDFDIGRSAIAAISGGDIAITSRLASISAGIAEPIVVLRVGLSPISSLPNVEYRGGGIFANKGRVDLVAKRDVNIGAGITAGAISIAAQNVIGGVGAISASGDVKLNVSGSISGNISAGGSVSVTGGATVSSGANISASGLVVGAGSVGSNTGAGKVSAETSVSSQGGSSVAAPTTETAAGAGNGRRGLVVDVTAEPAAGGSVDAGPPCQEGDDSCKNQ